MDFTFLDHNVAVFGELAVVCSPVRLQVPVYVLIREYFFENLFVHFCRNYNIKSFSKVV